MARWMNKLIYSFKIYLFRDQFNLTVKEKNNLREFCLFCSLFYVKAWIICTKASDAAINDLLLFKQINQYKTVNKVVSNAAMNKFKSHLWYLGSELVLLSLFSTKVPIEEKKLIVEKIKTCGEDWKLRGLKLTEIKNLENQNLHELVNSASICALRSLKINIDFVLNNEPETWKNLPNYQKAKTIVDCLKVVNDSAERSVSLMSAFNESITKNEKEMQKLLQVVEDHRKRVPNAQKSILQNYDPR